MKSPLPELAGVCDGTAGHGPRFERGRRVSAKSRMKGLLRPFARRMDARVGSVADGAFDAKLAPLSSGLRVELDSQRGGIENLQSQLASLRSEFEANREIVNSTLDGLAADVRVLVRNLPIVMNTIASQNAMSRDQQRRIRSLEPVSAGLAYLTDRIEFVRKELLFEQRYRGETSAPVRATEPKILNPEKLKLMGHEIRVNIGAGHISLPEYLNVDVRELPGIDIVADVTDLPFESGELTEIFSSHVLEHFPVEELKRRVLPYWVGLLKHGGKLVAVVPDIETMVMEHAAGRISFDDFREVVYGGQEYEGDFHFSGFSPESLVDILAEAGLKDIAVRETGRRNGLCYEMEVEATRTTEPDD